MVRRFDFFIVLGLMETFIPTDNKTKYTKASYFDLTLLSVLSDLTYEQLPYQSIEDDQETAHGNIRRFDFFSAKSEKLLFRTMLNSTNYSQTGCSFDGNFANFRRNIGILIDSLSRASCNLSKQVARFIWFLVARTR